MGEKTFEQRVVAAIGNNSGKKVFYRDLIIARGYKRSVDLIYNSIINDGRVDLLVYPLFFNSRHTIEVLYKIIIRQIRQIYKLKYKINQDDFLIKIDKILGKHNIRNLYVFLKEEATTLDVRIEEIINNGKIDNEMNILDFFKIFDIDKFADAFRYTFKRNGEDINLEDCTHLDVENHYEMFVELYNFLEYLCCCIDKLWEEYCTGSFTKKLSRSQLIDIAKKLPNHTKWKSQEFNQIKEQIKKEYNLTSNELSSAINIIKSKRFLADEIDIELPFKEFSSEFFEKYKDIRNIIEKGINNDNKQQVFSIISTLSKEDKVLMMSFIEMGASDFNYYDEELEAVYDSFLRFNNEELNNLLCKFILFPGDEFKKGLEICCQKTYLEKNNEIKT